MIETAHAILLLGDKCVLQLRDERPDISSPGQWSLFGGKIEPGERPPEAMIRELREELGIAADEWHALWPVDHFAEFERQTVRLWLFWGRVDSQWKRRELREGQDARAFGFDELAALEIPAVMRDVLKRFEKECRPLPLS